RSEGTIMTCINWLHITDLHIREKPAKDDNLYHVIKGSFLDDLKFLHDSCGPWDLLFLTGDLVFSGTEAQFEQADELLDKLLDELHALGARPQVLAVPGNHDLERPEKVLAAELMKWDKDVRDSFFEKKKSTYRDMVKKAFQNYQ